MASEGLWIGGGDHGAIGGGSFVRRSPFDGEAVSRFANGDVADVEHAITVARDAFEAGWNISSARARFTVLDRAAALLDTRRDTFAQSMVREAGKPVSLALAEVEGVIRTFQYYAGAALADEGGAMSERNPAALGLVLHEPVGVAGLISAWNFPLMTIACKLGPAIAAGCAVVAKPSHLAPGVGLLLARLFSEVGLPSGVFNLVTSDIDGGAVVGQALAGSTLVDKVSFTGSTLTGRAVMRAAAINNKRVSLELGGKSANIVFDDAPIDRAITAAVKAFTFNSGQQCSSGSRLLVQRTVHRRFVDALVAKVEALRIGDPAEPATEIGPLISAAQRNRVLGYVALGRQEGKVLTGGEPPSDGALAQGHFVTPCVVDEVAAGARLAQEEVFGPLLSVIPFDDEEDAVSKANASSFGLAGGVWTGSLDRALRVVKRIRTGKMFVNGYNDVGIDDMPHGGYKASGIGREFGREGLREFQQTKTVQIRIG
jgi:acyl-CoA reductase-like NAD-dependent aldehyde dehydrogenase